MSTERSFVEFVCEQLKDAGAITSRKMFGEYAIYHREKLVALVCDNQFFLKPTDGGARIIGNPIEARPFPQAKPYYLIADLDDPEWLAALIAITARELPEPKPKAKSKPKATTKSSAKPTLAKPKLEAKRRPSAKPTLKAKPKLEAKQRPSAKPTLNAKPTLEAKRRPSAKPTLKAKRSSQ